MVTYEEEKEKVLKELRGFYKKAMVESRDYAGETIFTIEPYTIRDSEGLACKVGLLIRNDVKYVLIDSTFDEITSYSTNRDETIAVGNAQWLSVEKKYFWDSSKPSYWFVERNLTEFFRRRNSKGQ